MAISFVGQASAEATSISLPAHQADDIIIIWTFRDGVATSPSLPAGYTNIHAQTQGTVASRLGYRVAVSSSETSGTWTNATEIVVHIYRGATTSQTPIIFGNTGAGSSSTNIDYAASAKSQMNNWLVAFVGHASIDTGIENPPSPLMNRSNIVGATAEAAGHDSNTSLNRFILTTVAAGGTAAGYITESCWIIPEEVKLNNYSFFDTGDGMSTTEKIR